MNVLMTEFNCDDNLFIRPMKMELTASNESVLVENMDIFLKNGFKFQINVEGLLVFSNNGRCLDNDDNLN